MKLVELFEDLMPNSIWSYSSVERELDDYDRQIGHISSLPVIGTIQGFDIKELEKFGREHTVVVVADDGSVVGFSMFEEIEICGIDGIAITVVGFRQAVKGNRLSVDLYDFLLDRHGMVLSDESQTIRGNRIWQNWIARHPNEIHTYNHDDETNTGEIMDYDPKDMQFGRPGQRLMMIKSANRIS